MANPLNAVFDVTTRDFDTCVLKRSHDIPILVDFWAAWCAPCKVLTPILEKLAAEYGGRIAVAKVNADEQADLVAEYGVRSLPTVKIFKEGKIVDERIGAQPESVFRELIDDHLPRESNRLQGTAMAQLREGNIDGAHTLLMQALTLDPDNTSLQIDLAEILIARSDFDAAIKILQALPLDQWADSRAKRLRALAEFSLAAHAADDSKTLEARLARHPDDLQARYQLAAQRVVSGDYPHALDQLLFIMQQDRAFRDDLGHRALLAAFDILGEGNELVARYRRKMATLLF